MKITKLIEDNKKFLRESKKPTKELPRDRALRGQHVVSEVPKVGDYVDFYSPSNGDKQYGKVVKVDNKNITFEVDGKKTKMVLVKENYFLGQAQPGPVGGPWAADDVENYTTFETERSLDRLNTFVQSMDFGQYLDPYAAVNQLFKRLHVYGIHFHPASIEFTGKSGCLHIPVSRMGGVTGPDLQGNYAPSHGFARVPEGMSLQINYEKHSGRTYITAEIVRNASDTTPKGDDKPINESSSTFEYVRELKNNCKIGLMRDEMSRQVVIETWCEEDRKSYREIPYGDDVEKAVREAKLAIDRIVESEVLSESIFSIFDSYPLHFDNRGEKISFKGDPAAALIKGYVRIDKEGNKFTISVVSGVKNYETVRKWAEKSKPKGTFELHLYNKELKNSKNAEFKNWSDLADYFDSYANPAATHLLNFHNSLKTT